MSAKRSARKKKSASDRIDYDDQGELDDICISDVTLFRMEWMHDGCVWIRLYRDTNPDGDLVFWLNSRGKIKGLVEEDDGKASLPDNPK